MDLSFFVDYPILLQQGGIGSRYSCNMRGFLELDMTKGRGKEVGIHTSMHDLISIVERTSGYLDYPYVINIVLLLY